ncbi:MAG: glutathione synthase, partial [Proteobacteria bacterium]|nr:glutathione synthase [Pseudomonadota bacterium]
MTSTPPRALRLAFVMDPIEAVSIHEDTTFAFMLAAQARGHEIFYVDPAELRVVGGRAAAVVVPVSVRREEGNHVERGEPRHVVLDESVDVAFQRVDPPVDADYITATQILGLCETTLVLNRPDSVIACNEKLTALRFREFMVATEVSRNPSELLDFMNKQGGEMVVKPLDGRGGEGVFHVHSADRNLTSILEQATNFGRRWTMAQGYIPDVRRGDKRILLLEGEPIGALLRVPAENEVRANLHVGGRAVKAELDERDREICARLGPVLRRDGLFFVGIDVIGG